MTEVLKRARAVIEARTKGPWWVDLWGVMSAHAVICEVQTQGATVEAPPVRDTFILSDDGRVVMKGGMSLADISEDEANANAHFIALLGTVANEVWDVVEAANRAHASGSTSAYYLLLDERLDALEAALTAVLGEK